MGPHFVGAQAFMTTMFHGQSLDTQGIWRVGDFFTNLTRGLISTLSRIAADPPCTDLSTAHVDKEISLSDPVSYVTFVR
jgi:hypothetical protein